MKKCIKNSLLATLSLSAVCALSMGAFGVKDASAEGATLPSGTTVDMYLIAGQSNAAGYSAKGSENATYGNVWYTGETNRKMDGSSGINVTMGDITSYTNVASGMGYTAAHIGPEYGMAKVLNDYYAGETKALIVKSAAGGTHLCDYAGGEDANFGNWYPRSLWAAAEADPETNAESDPTGVQYYNFVENFKTVYAELKTEGYTPVVKGMVWMQGCSDTQTSNYDELLKTFIDDIRNDIYTVTQEESDKTMPFIIGEISAPNAAGSAAFRVMQREVAAAKTKTYTVKTDDLSYGSDNWHFTTQGAVKLGERFGEKLAQTVKITPTGDIVVTGASVYIGNETTENGVDKNGIRFQVLAKKTVVGGGAEIGALLLPADMTTATELKVDTTVIQNEEIEGTEAVTNQTFAADKWTASDYADYLQTNVYLYNFPENDFNREILVSAYIKSGENYTYSDTISRSMAYVALEAEKDGDARAADYIKSYHVNYYGEDGETEIDGSENVGVRYGSLIEKPADPETSGKEFIGWYTDKACTEVFDFENTTVKGTTNLYSKWENFVTVTGSYSYTSGTYANGVYTNTGDTVTVAAGKYTGSVNTENQTYTIELPQSVKEITLSSKMFCDVKAAVADTTAAEASFSVPKMTPVETFNVVTYSENGFTLTNKNSSVNNYLFTESAVATGGFVVKYTVTASTTDWLNQGGFAMKMGDKYYRMAVTNNGTITIQSGVSGVSSWDSESKYTGATMPYATNGNKLTVTVAYYNETFYMQCENATNKKAISFDYSTTAFTWGTPATNKAMCNAGDKTIGLCAPGATVAFENVSYAIGDEVAKTTAQAMQLAIDSMTVAAGAKQLFACEPAAAGEGFVVNFTLGASANSGSWFNNGGLYVKLGDGRYHLITFNTANKSTLRVSIYDSVKNTQVNLNNSTIAYTGASAVEVKIVFYNGAYYIKFGENTIKYDNTKTYSYIDKANIFDTTQTRSFGLCGAINTVKASFSGISYAIGNDVAKAAAQEMGFTL